MPTIFGANKMSLNEIAGAAKDLAKQAQEGTISPDLLVGASFTVSNLGTYGGTFHAGHQPAADGHPGSEQHPDEAEDGGRGSGAVPGDGNFADITTTGRSTEAPASRFAQELCRTLENFMALLAK